MDVLVSRHRFVDRLCSTHSIACGSTAAISGMSSCLSESKSSTGLLASIRAFRRPRLGRSWTFFQLAGSPYLCVAAGAGVRGALEGGTMPFSRIYVTRFP